MYKRQPARSSASCRSRSSSPRCSPARPASSSTCRTPSSCLLYTSDAADEEDKLAVSRARKIERFLSQPFFVAEVFTGSPGKLVALEDTIKGFKGLVNGEYDNLPEAAFYMVGSIDEAVEKAKKLAAA